MPLILAVFGNDSGKVRAMEHLLKNPSITPDEFLVCEAPPINDAIANAVKNHYADKSVIIVAHSPANIPRDWRADASLAIIANDEDSVSVATPEGAVTMPYEDLETLDVYFPNLARYQIRPHYLG